MYQNASAPTYARPRRRSRGGAGCLVTLFLLLIVILAGWFLVARPYLHNMAVAKVDRALNAANSPILEKAALLPPGGTLTVQENAINNVLVLNTAPSGPVQQPVVHITPKNIRLDFQVYGFPCAITQVPTAQDGQLVAKDVTVEGVVGLIISPEEITTLLNKHYRDIQSRTKHSIQNVQLKDQEMDLVLG